MNPVQARAIIEELECISATQKKSSEETNKSLADIADAIHRLANVIEAKVGESF